MPQKIVILLTFANDQDAYLENLKQESSRIYFALSPLEDRGAIQLFREESATSNNIIHAFNRFDGHVGAFHYGGHANGKGLSLEDLQGQAEGLARLLARQQNLHFVFLNGCSTQPQVVRLLELGVPVVIATTSKISDPKATAFAGFFYEKLANRGSIRQAFEYASDSLLFKYQDFQKPEIHQLSATRDNVPLRGASAEVALPWGLYYDEQKPEGLDWNLPLSATPTLSRPGEGTIYEVNEFLYPILEEMSQYDTDIEEDLERIEDDREYFEMIIKNFPWNIGSQFGLLVAEKKATISRLQQIVSTYIACGQWAYYVAFSQLWQAWLNKKIDALDPPPAQITDINKDSFLHFDYFHNFRQALQILHANNIPLFVGELDKLYTQLKKGGELYDAYLFLESIRGQVVNPSFGPHDDMITLCADAEFALAELLCSMAFLVSYQMVTVRDILVHNPRHVNTKYFHQIGRLNAHTDERLFFYRNPKAYEDVLESDAVLLFKDLKNTSHYLSLSPFFIDRNAFRDKAAELTDLYTYAYAKWDANANTNTFYYLKSSRNLIAAHENQLDQLCTNEMLVEDSRRRSSRKLKGRHLRKNTQNQPYAMLQEQLVQLTDFLK